MDVFWLVSAPDGSSGQNFVDLVLCRLERPLPPHCRLAVFARIKDVELCVALAGEGLGFEGARIVPIALRSEADDVTLTFRTLRDAGDTRVGLSEVVLSHKGSAAAAAEAGRDLAIALSSARVRFIEAQAAPARPWLKLLSRGSAAGEVLPAERQASEGVLKFQVRDLWAARMRRTAREGIDPPMHFGFEVKAQSIETQQALDDTKLWHASRSTLSPHPPIEGFFQPNPDGHTGFRNVAPRPRGAGPADRLMFEVPGAAFGDLFCLVPGLPEAPVAGGGGERMATAVLYEIEYPAGNLSLLDEAQLVPKREGAAKKQPAPEGLGAAGASASDKAQPELKPDSANENDTATAKRPGLLDIANAIKTRLKDQVTTIKSRWNGRRREIERFAHAAAPHLRAMPVAHLAAVASTPAQFFAALALFDDVLDALGASEQPRLHAAIQDRPSALFRLASSALRIALNRSDVGKVLLESGRNTDPWDEGDALWPLFDALIEEGGKANHSAWYEAGDAEGLEETLAVVLLALDGETQRARRLVAFGLSLTLADLNRTAKIDEALATAEPIFRKDAISAFVRALLLAAARHTPNPDPAMRRHKAILDGLNAGGSPPGRVPMRDMLIWSAWIQLDQLLAQARRIEACWNATPGTTGALIPRLTKATLPSAKDSVAALDQFGVMPPNWRALVDEACAPNTQWLPASLAALVLVVGMPQVAAEEAPRPPPGVDQGPETESEDFEVETPLREALAEQISRLHANPLSLDAVQEAFLADGAELFAGDPSAFEPFKRRVWEKARALESEMSARFGLGPAEFANRPDLRHALGQTLAEALRRQIEAGHDKIAGQITALKQQFEAAILAAPPQAKAQALDKLKTEFDSEAANYSKSDARIFLDQVINPHERSLLRELGPIGESLAQLVTAEQHFATLSDELRMTHNNI